MSLVGYKRMQWQNRAHFFAVSAQLMRRVLVDHARRHNLKRGGGVPHVSLDEAVVVAGDPGADLVALDDALNALGASTLAKGASSKCVFLPASASKRPPWRSRSRRSP